MIKEEKNGKEIFQIFSLVSQPVHLEKVKQSQGDDEETKQMKTKVAAGPSLLGWSMSSIGHLLLWDKAFVLITCRDEVLRDFITLGLKYTIVAQKFTFSSLKSTTSGQGLA